MKHPLSMDMLGVKCHRFGKILLAFVILSVLLVLFGQLFYYPALTGYLHPLPSVEIYIAANFLLMAFAFWLCNLQSSVSIYKNIGCFCFLIVAIVNGVAIFDYMVGDRWILVSNVPMRAVYALTLMGIAGFGVGWFRRYMRIAQFPILIAMGIALFILLRWIFEWPLVQMHGTTPFAAFLLLLLGLSFLFSWSTFGFFERLNSPYSGGLLIRRLLPLAILTPFIFGLILILGLHHTAYSFAALLAYVVIACMVVLVIILWEIARLFDERDQSHEQLEKAARISEADYEKKVAREALQERERQYQRLVELSPYGIAIVIQGRFRYVNSAMVNMLGAKSSTELVGKSILDFIHLESRDLVSQRMYQVNEERGVVPTVREKWIKTDKTDINVEETSSSFTYEGSPAVLMSVNDITNQLNLTRQLQQAQRMEAMGQLTGGVAHDFNNLLMIVQGNLELLGHALQADPKSSKRIEASIKAIEKGSELTRRLLAFSRKQSLQPELVNLHDVMTELLNLLKPTLGESIEINIDIADDIWPVVVDMGQLEGSLVNLAVNSRDAMKGTGKLMFNLSNVTLDHSVAMGKYNVKPGSYVKISLTDNGCGMSPEVLEHVFEPFFTTKEVGRGSGLGLSMVYGFVKQSNGHVTIYSEVDHGTTVNIYLPKALVPKTPVEEKKLSGVAAGVHGNEIILVVEDEPALRELSVEYLWGLGYQIYQASNGQEALNILKEQLHIDLLFTDIVMPGGMTGPELAKEAKKLHPEMKVLFTSGYPRDALEGENAPDEKAHLLMKPYKMHDLVAALRQSLDGKN